MAVLDLVHRHGPLKLAFKVILQVAFGWMAEWRRYRHKKATVIQVQRV